MRMTFTVQNVKQIAETPHEREVIYSDELTRGLIIRARPKASAAFMFRYKVGAKKLRVHIALCSEMSLKDARARALKMRAAKGDGLDPRVDEDAKRRMLFGDLLDRYLEDHARLKKKASSLKQDVRVIEAYIRPALGNRLLSSVRRSDIIELRDRSAKAAKSRANSIVAIVSKAFSLALEWELIEPGSNPCVKIRKFKFEERTRFLKPAEIQAFALALERLEQHHPAHAILFRLLLFTGARLSEISKARLEWVDLDAKVIELPDSKTGRAVVRLSDLAVEQIKRIERPKRCPWLLPNPKTGEPIMNPYHEWRWVMAQAGLKGVRIHDLRHTFASYTHRGGATQRTVSRLLNHRVLATSERYIKGFEEDLTQATNETGRAFLTMIED